jgi:hypothetical protein
MYCLHLQGWRVSQASNKKQPASGVLCSTAWLILQFGRGRHYRPLEHQWTDWMASQPRRQHTSWSPLSESHILTYSHSWALLEKLPIVQPLKNFPAIYGTQRHITLFTRSLHWSLSSARSIQSIPSHPIYLRSMLISHTT